ncbi:C2H2 finger domain protein (Zms1), putative [Metarhizium acridum CQMa 102]|uniref:C2H2 finger domain protein (Zms1), putative n=1 Tax=Metarhizium acridum (strain CQMa 102) TaxID=655827 RepID=E9DWY3_METAQ|nr:C2H2 finger domain protein (Zms1), putative [Metarhizium acridum CQMa 102]EFY91846.1 C2H2 finger domain protein (Zms1), putative [Metarhizium acridum CQMa 102]
MQTGCKHRGSPVSPGESGGDDALLVNAVKKSYRCSTCAQEFSRPDHLRRHALSHGVADNSPMADSGSDARSIKALLDNGTQSFTEIFDLPSFSDETGDLGPPLKRSRIQHFWTEPWMNDPGEGDLDGLFRANVPSMLQQCSLAQASKSETPQITALRDVMMRSTQQLNLQASSFDELSAIIGLLCCQPKIDTFVATELLISIITFSAMYSHDKTDRLAARKLLNIAELVVFSAEIFAASHEIKHASHESTAANSTQKEWDWYQFQQVQAGYLITTVQYRAGTRQAKIRPRKFDFARSSRFSGTNLPTEGRKLTWTGCPEIWIDPGSTPPSTSNL